MKISDQSMSTGVLRQNILEKANEAFSENKKPEEFSKKINEANSTKIRIRLGIMKKFSN